MLRIRRLAPCLLVLALLLASAGCRGRRADDGVGPYGNRVPYNPRETGGDVAIHRDVQFSDIPVPMGFLLDRKKSYSFRGNSFRFGSFLYEGAWSLNWTGQFYREQMPASGWRLLEAERVDPLRHETQLYAKGKERARVDIRSGEDLITVALNVYKAKARPGRPGGDEALVAP